MRPDISNQGTIVASKSGKLISTSRRKIFLFVLFCILLFVPILIVHFGFWPGNLQKSPPKQEEEHSLKVASMMSALEKSPSSFDNTSAPVQFAPEATNVSEPYSTLLPVDESQVFISGNRSGNVAVVDLTRVADALPAASTPEARQKKLAQIQKAVSAVAAARNFSFVFDKSALTPIDTPVVLFDNGAIDLTAAVLQMLKK